MRSDIKNVELNNMRVWEIKTGGSFCLDRSNLSYIHNGKQLLFTLAMI